MAALEILHLTDPHLLAAAHARLHGWQVETSFGAVLADALRRYPDCAALVLGGDLVDDESVAGYQRLDARLRALGRPVLAMAGNHDDPARMQRHLAAAAVHGVLDIGGWRLVALDSHRPGTASGHLGERRIEALTQTLGACPHRPTLVFVHHPPVAVGSAWVDAIGLDDGAALRTCLAAQPQVRAVVCGHAHQDARIDCGGFDCLVTPSTMRQFLPGATDFGLDPKRGPGYRCIELDDHGRWRTRVHRVAVADACG